MSLFPLIDAPDTGQAPSPTTLPLAREVDWDFKTNTPVWRNGEPVIVTGQRAVLVWAWNALHTPRFAHDVFSHNYGLEVDALIGKPYSAAVRQSEAVRMVRDALLINPYITAVHQIYARFEGSTLYLTYAISTIYGEVKQDEFDIAL